MTDEQARMRTVRRVLLVILVLNWGVALAKVTVGLVGGFAAVTADGLHSFIDGSSNVMGLFAIAIAARPADEDHPYGHGKFEAIAALGIGAMVGVGMLELGRMAFGALVHGSHPQVSSSMVIVLVVTLAVNLTITRVETWYGRKLKSQLLLADAKHTLSDVFVTLSVLASVFLVWAGFPQADGVVALVVLGVVAWVAYGIVRHAIGVLADSVRLSPAAVRAVATSVPGVRSCRNVRSRGLETAVYVDLAIEVDPRCTTSEAHALAHQVEGQLRAAFPHVVDVVVHVEPAEGR